MGEKNEFECFYKNGEHMRRVYKLLSVPTILVLFASCAGGGGSVKNVDTANIAAVQRKVDAFAEVSLTASIDHLTEKEKQMLPILFRAAQIMDDLFWRESFGNKDSLLSSLPNDAYRAFAEINYGPWERLNGNEPFIEGYGDKPLGAGFYPTDMSKEEFEAFRDGAKESQYTVIVRDEKGGLKSVPYHVYFSSQIQEAASLLEEASGFAEDEGLKNYLLKRAEALRTDEYLTSDLAWMDMKSNRIDVVIGPIENYEDKLFGCKAAHESFILLKDMEWTRRLAHYATLLPALQRTLPVEEKYKSEQPGSDSDLGAYDVVFYAGDCNAGSKTIAINLPNDPKVHVEKGSRKLQLKNAMRYKFDKIVVPIAELLIVPAQRQHVTFDAFFENTMFHEVAHGLGIKQTITGKGDVQSSLKETYSAMEEGKADILGIYMVEQMVKMGELKDHDLMDNYVTFMAGIFRSVRFGAASAHGKANMVRFHYFQDMGAFTRNAEGFYEVNAEKMSEAVSSLSRDILVLQGNGDYDGARKMLAEQGVVDDLLQSDLGRINSANIPIDLRYKQGPEQLGLRPYVK